MDRFRHLLLICWLGLLAASGARAGDMAAPSLTPSVLQPGDFIVLAYHEIADDVRELGEADAVSTRQFANQLSWLRENGYHPVSVQQILDARAGIAPLPERAVLLSFDDGYRSLYEKAYPLLLAFGYPGVASLVGEWMQAPAGTSVSYGDKQLPRESFLSWEQAREMQASGLIEFGSHSYAQHRALPANPQGNVEPAIVTAQYDPATQSYESARDWEIRVRADLARNSALIQHHLGKAPRVMTWPYGRYNGKAIDIANDLGMLVCLTLDEGINHPAQALSRTLRNYLIHNPELSGFTLQFHTPSKPHPVRLMHVDLDYVFDADPARQESNLSLLLDRVRESGATHVFLQAFRDSTGEGHARALYFPNRHMPMAADLFNRVAWQLFTRAGVQVFAWMPLLAFDLPAGNPLRGERVQALAGHETASYLRLSPFSPAARQVILDLYEDLARAAPIEGILIHDDAMLNDFEDASPQALAVYAKEWGLPASIDAIRANPQFLRAWTEKKIDWLDALAQDAAARAQRWRAPLKLARNFYAAPILDRDAETWFAQSVFRSAPRYDLLAIMAMPFMERADKPQEWLDTLVARIQSDPAVASKAVFELQARDWRNNADISGETLAAQMRRLTLQGVLNFGYYPDDFIRGQPQLPQFKSEFSRRSQPERR